MAQAIQAEKVTPADELRSLLADSEKLLANVPNSGASIERLLTNIDRLCEVWPQLEAAGVDLRPEEGRFDTIQAQVHKQMTPILRELGAAGGLSAVRAKRGLPPSPPPDAGPAAAGQVSAAQAAAAQAAAAQATGWWWYLDYERRQSFIKTARRYATVAVVVLVVGAVLVFVLNKLFPTDPKVAASSGKQMAGQQLIENGGDIGQATANFQEAADLTPGDPDAWLWLGVAQEKQGHAAEAQAAYAKAQALLKDEMSFHMARAPIYLAFGSLDQGKADLDFVFAQDPENPQAHYYLAGLYEAQGNLTAASQELEKTSQYAEARNQSELTAIARYRMGMLLQAMQVRPDSASGATPTPTAAP
jgi:Tfp pilus assembly protein PilF